MSEKEDKGMVPIIGDIKDFEAFFHCPGCGAGELLLVKKLIPTTEEKVYDIHVGEHPDLALYNHGYCLELRDASLLPEEEYVCSACRYIVGKTFADVIKAGVLRKKEEPPAKEAIYNIKAKAEKASDRMIIDFLEDTSYYKGERKKLEDFATGLGYSVEECQFEVTLGTDDKDPFCFHLNLICTCPHEQSKKATPCCEHMEITNGTSKKKAEFVTAWLAQVALEREGQQQTPAVETDEAALAKKLVFMYETGGLFTTPDGGKTFHGLRRGNLE